MASDEERALAALAATLNAAVAGARADEAVTVATVEAAVAAHPRSSLPHRALVRLHLRLSRVGDAVLLRHLERAARAAVAGMAAAPDVFASWAADDLLTELCEMLLDPDVAFEWLQPSARAVWEALRACGEGPAGRASGRAAAPTPVLDAEQALVVGGTSPVTAAEMARLLNVTLWEGCAPPSSPSCRPRRPPLPPPAPAPAPLNAAPARTGSGRGGGASSRRSSRSR